MRQTLESECIRQIDKTNNNRIGYFHQYLFKYAGNGWEVPDNGDKGGFDVLNDELHFYVEMKNKHNTMNRSSSSDTYVKMQNKILKDDKATVDGHFKVYDMATSYNEMINRLVAEVSNDAENKNEEEINERVYTSMLNAAKGKRLYGDAPSLYATDFKDVDYWAFVTGQK